MQRRETLNTDKGLSNVDLCVFCYPSSEMGITPEIVYEDEEVYALPALGQFTEGYLLLIHQEHEDCFGEVANGDIRTVKERVREVLTEEYGGCCFFEHGRAGSCLRRSANRICYHAHLHCLPISVDFSDRIAEDFERIELNDWVEVRELSEEYPNYLYLETDDGTKNFFVVEGDIERQYLRKRACEALDLSTELSNWAEYPLYDNIDNTVDTLKGKLGKISPKPV